MKLLIIGKNGFVGRSLTEYFNGISGYEVTAVSHDELNIENDVRHFFEDNYFDCVIDAAVCYEADNLVQTNINMYENLEKCSSNYGRLIFFGSGAEYNKSLDIVDVCEEEVCDRCPSDAYGIAKREVGKLIEQSVKSYNLRIFGLYGKYENYRQKFITGCCAKAVLGLPLTIRQNVFFDFLYIDDFCRMVKSFIELDNPKHHTYNIVSGKKIDLNSLAKTVKEKSGKDLPIIVSKEGLANEYTANGDRLISEIEFNDFTSYDTAIDELLEFFEEKKDEIGDVANNV